MAIHWNEHTAHLSRLPCERNSNPIHRPDAPASGPGGPPLLRPVSEPICRYLRSRPDTVKCLVAMVTFKDQDGEGGDGDQGGQGAAGALMEELRKVSGKGAAVH